jgi:hypothetical protein
MCRLLTRAPLRVRDKVWYSGCEKPKHIPSPDEFLPDFSVCCSTIHASSQYIDQDMTTA